MITPAEGSVSVVRRNNVHISGAGSGGPIMMFAHGFAIADVTQGVVPAKTGKRADFGIVRKRRYRADPGIRSCAMTQRAQPFPGDDRVRIEQHDIAARLGMTGRSEARAALRRARRKLEGVSHELVDVA